MLFIKHGPMNNDQHAICLSQQPIKHHTIYVFITATIKPAETNRTATSQWTTNQMADYFLTLPQLPITQLTMFKGLRIAK